MQRILFVCILLSLFAVACSQTSKSGQPSSAQTQTPSSAPAPTPEPSFEYPEEFRTEIVAGCTEATGGERDLCVCIVDELEHNVAPEDVTRLGAPLDPTDLNTNELPPEFTNAFAKCVANPTA